jgi:glycosyltransferase involved in cell wall biosynthesis
MRILFVCNWSDFFLGHIKPLADEWARRGAEVHVASPDSHVDVGYPHHRIRMTRRGISPMEIIAIIDIRKLIKRLQPDLVQNIALKASLYGSIAAGRTPAVNLITGLGHLFVSRSFRVRVVRKFVEQGFKLLCWDRTYIFQNQNDMFVFHPLVDPARCHVVVGCGVDMERFAYSEPHDRPVVLFSGRMLKTKGVLDLIEAAPRINGEVWLAGLPDDGNPASIDARVLRNAPCKWLGHVFDMPAAIRECSVFCLPSYGEGAPKSLIEAAAIGRPIVATNVQGCTEVCRHGLNGLLVPPRDPAALAAAINELLRDGARRRQFALAGRKMAMELFDLRLVIPQTFKVYEKLADRGDFPINRIAAR